LRRADKLIGSFLLDSRCTLASTSSASARLADCGALRIDAGHQIVPGFNEGRGAFLLQPDSECIDVDTRLGEAGQNFLAVAAVRSKYVADFAVIDERLQGLLRHGVHRERCGERFNIKCVWGLWILCAGARPEQALGASAGVGSTLEARRSEQLPICPVGA